MNKWECSYLSASNIRFHYTRTGGGKPPLVLAHGFSEDGFCWTPVAAALQGEYDVVMLDARCHGRSEAPEAPFDRLDMAADLASALTELGLKRPPILGHSMGAITALVLAGAYPELPGAVLLEDPPARWMRAEPEAPLDESWKAPTRARLERLKTMTREQLIEEQRQAFPRWREEELGLWADAKLRVHLNCLNRKEGPDAVDWNALLARISCPVLLITGDPDRGAMLKPEQAERLRELVPQLQVAHIPGAGHSIRREGFEPYMRAVRGFLAETGRAT
jgi:pimeloyl-ACP methyl ester carboxylesterase